MRCAKSKAPPAWLVEGAMADYHSVIGEPPTEFNLRVRTDPQLMDSGHWVVWLEGKAGCVSVDACTPASGSLGPSNDDSPHVQLEMQAAERVAAIASEGVGGESDVWQDDATTEIAGGAWQDQFNAALWAWDISRPIAGQYEEHAGLQHAFPEVERTDDAVAISIETLRADPLYAKVQEVNATGPDMPADAEPRRAEDREADALGRRDQRAGGCAVSAPEVVLLKRHSWPRSDGRQHVHESFEIRGGDIAPEWAAGGRSPRAAPWCTVLWNEGECIGSFGGEVWPMAWPELFRLEGPVGQQRHVLTDAGVAAFAAARKVGAS